MSGVVYRTVDRDMLDALCWKHYGRENAVTVVLEANPGLAEYGEVLPAGVEILLPELPAAAPAPQPIRLWD